MNILEKEIKKCEICGIQITKYNIGMHVKKYHGIDPDEYKLKYFKKKKNYVFL
jgi:hypothetical protein